MRERLEGTSREQFTRFLTDMGWIRQPEGSHWVAGAEVWAYEGRTIVLQPNPCTYGGRWLADHYQGTHVTGTWDKGWELDFSWPVRACAVQEALRSI